MFEKIQKRVLRQRYYLYRKLADFSFRKVDEYSPKFNSFWLDMCAKFTRKEFEMFRKLKGRDAQY